MPSQTCNQCSNVNPADASYCYFDGVRLAGGAGGPVNAATQNFPSAFVFPSGQQCRNFDQFATTCSTDWSAAVKLLKDGMLASFFGGMGRSDLAMAASEAAKAPDLDRGLDQFLAKLPTQALQAAKLKVEPTDINLGQMSFGQDRTIELNLSNTGMRLLYGSIASDSKWLTLGDAPGTEQKLFQFGTEATLPLQIRGKELRASPKPLEAQLLIESSGGNVTVTVRVTVPMIPFKDGPLAGCKSPREVAEKARGNAAEAAPYFEKGAVAQWFATNGWDYPVKGPSAKGLGAVQQFFEALGLAKAPKVEISAQSLSLKGAPGGSVGATLDVTTQEKKPVYAHAVCEQPWVDVSNVKLAGRTATITVMVKSIPNRPGETLQANIHVSGNGNQRFTVPLSLAVGGSAAVAAGAPPMAPADNPFAFGDRPAPARTSPAAAAAAAPLSKEAAAQKRKEMLIHGIPIGVMMIAMLILLIRDFFFAPAPAPPGGGDAPAVLSVVPKIVVLFDYPEATEEEKDLAKELKIVAAKKSMAFGVWVPTKKSNEEWKKLFYGQRGGTNNTLLSIDGTETTFGKTGSDGEWEAKPTFTHWDKQANMPACFYKGAEATWKVGSIYVTQKVAVIPGESVETSPDKFERFYDTCEVTYKIENKGSKIRKFGMRILLDTLIGDNDGVPFAIPGQEKLIYYKKFEGTKIPDFITALEKDDLKDPGVVVQLNLRHAPSYDAKLTLEAPEKLLLTRWPGAMKTVDLQKKAIELWKIDLENPSYEDNKKETKADSSVVLYWSVAELEKGEPRNLGYSYALSSLHNASGGRIALSVGGIMVKGNDISVVAQVSNAKPNEKIRLDLPAGLTLAAGDLEQPVPASSGGRPSPVTWKLTATSSGTFPLKAHTSIDKASASKRIVIREPGVLGG